MEIKEITSKATSFLKKYRYAILIFVIGLILITLPTSKDSTKDTKRDTNTQTSNTLTLDVQLSQMLTKIDGAGSVEVMLNIAEGEEIVYQENINTANDTDSNDRSTTTVIITNSEKSQSGLVRQTNPPVYLGAVVLCQGADDPVVKLAIVDAVSKITGLGANCISVLKMK